MLLVVAHTFSSNMASEFGLYLSRGVVASLTIDWRFSLECVNMKKILKLTFLDFVLNKVLPIKNILENKFS